MATFIGAGLAGISLLVALGTLICKLLFWDSFAVDAAATTISAFFLGAAQLFFIGILDQYVLSNQLARDQMPSCDRGGAAEFQREGQHASLISSWVCFPSRPDADLYGVDK